LNDKYLQAYLSDLVLKSLFEFATLELVHSLEYFDLANAFKGFFPLRLVECSSSKNDEISAVLSQELDALHIILVNQLSEVAINDLLLDSELVLVDIWQFLKH
jgi:hypothetical protein